MYKLKLPESDIILKDYPVWIVTFNGVNLLRSGPKQSNTNSATVYADKNVVIDANNGVELETFSYGSSLK
ncbi:hypothetical protein [Ruminiclostridium papyrosolvens]|uniref:Uncharacterized protein n=1 Tax=Ruminiclostridium papyrosolvens C7 TaxID=1330534 RepID=U4R3G1_9FIRM|nr:hypothetical protein [Ruminiclostridium papyrosolvens]EPR13029.1 hypothetical protein L323_06830 [Ruminiclostridium papyrosolvens C7]